MSSPSRGAGAWNGVRAMLSRLTLRPTLAATASAAALMAGVVFLLPHAQLPRPGQPGALVRTASEPAAAPGPTVTAEPSAEPSAGPAAKALPAPPPAPMAAPLADKALRPLDAGSAGGAYSRPAGPSEAAAGTVAPMAGDGVELAAPDTARPPRTDSDEAFASAAANGVTVAAETPVSTFSVDVDTASYAVVRSSLNAGRLPPADAVRIEEMVNYFPYAYPTPEAGGPPIRPSVSVSATPWNPDTLLLRVGLQGRVVAQRPPLDLVFLIDTSGSMEDANKLPLLRQALALMLGRLAPEDRVAIVTYAGSAGLVLDPTPASDRDAILGALDRLTAGGSTAGQEGLQQAYSVAESMRRDGSVRRVILATDGDFNVGISDPAALAEFIAGQRDGGTYLSVLGFGRGNLDDATMQALAQNGNGQAAYIDTLSEAQKVLADQLTGALVPIADDVKVQVEFNPAVVAEYRLIGYETRALRREDFTNDRVDAGEVGSGHQVTALYEVTPVGSPAVRNPPLRYGAGAAPPAAIPDKGLAGELGFLRLRWKEPGSARSAETTLPIPAAAGPADADARFAAAIAGMGQLLRHEPYLGHWGWRDAIALADGARGPDPFGYRAEAVQLMRLAESLSR
ncbi:MAG: vWA domain-containing protein [Pseudomonadota bacterium]